MPLPEIDDVVVPLHLQPVVDRPRGWHGRSANLVAVALVGFVVIAVVLGRTLDSGPSSPAAVAMATAGAPASARPTPSPEPTPPSFATPLPAVEVFGTHLPTERRLVFASGYQMLDLATGVLEPTVSPLYDQMLSVGDDQLVCACSLGGIPGGDASVPPSIRFGRYDLSGRALVQRTMVTLADVVAVPDVTSGVTVASELGADQRTLHVLVATRRPPSWSIDLYDVAVDTGRVLGHRALGRLPVEPAPATPASPGPGSPSPSAVPVERSDPTPDGLYVWGTDLAIGPDGGTLYASVSYVDLRDGVWLDHEREWLIPVRDDRSGTPARVKTGDNLSPGSWCISPPIFVDTELIVQACLATSIPTDQSGYVLRRLAMDGTSLPALPITALPFVGRFPLVTMVDVPGRAMFIWDPVSRTIGRIDVDTGTISSSPAGNASGVGDGETGGPIGIGSSPSLVESPDGRRIYALGVSPRAGSVGGSSGIWVFDARTLEPIGHWAARALLTSLAISADGAFVYAAGANGFDPDGNPTRWPASVTVYDAASGAVQVVYGSVTSDSSLTFAALP